MYIIVLWATYKKVNQATRPPVQFASWQIEETG